MIAVAVEQGSEKSLFLITALCRALRKTRKHVCCGVDVARDSCGG